MSDASVHSDFDKQSHRFTHAIQNDEVKESLRLIEDLKFFLATAPANWQENQVIRRYYLSADEGFVSCIFWNNLYFITGTDIVRCIVYKFQQFGRKIIDRKKFEEGIFSDLRNLKCGTDAILEPPKSDFLDFLYKNNCLRTQKKQKVFFWFNVPHDKLMADALERDLKKEKLGQKPTTIADKEPALSFKYEEEKMLYSQLLDYNKKTNVIDDSTDENVDSTISTNQTDEDAKETSDSKKKDTEEEEQEEVVPVSEDSKKHKAQAQESTTQPKRKKLTLGLDRNPPPPGFDFLAKETPDQFKQDPEDEDDFPLDYFQGASNDYILIDSSTNYINFPHFVENSEGSAVPFPYPISSQVVVNDEYLIEQTLPVKTPMPLRSGKLDELHQFAPLSGKMSSFPMPPYSNQYPGQYANPYSQFGQYLPPSAGVPNSATYPMHFQALPPLAPHASQPTQPQALQPPQSASGATTSGISTATTATGTNESENAPPSATGQQSSEQTSTSEAGAVSTTNQPATATATSISGTNPTPVPAPLAATSSTQMVPPGPPSAQQVHFYPQYYAQDPYMVHDQEHWYPDQYMHSPYLVVPEQEAMYYGGHMYPYPQPPSGYLPPPNQPQAAQSSRQPNTSTPGPTGAPQPQHLYIQPSQGGPTPSPAFSHFQHYPQLPNSPYTLANFSNRQTLGGPMIKRTMMKPLNKINEAKPKKDE